MVVHLNQRIEPVYWEHDPMLNHGQNARGKVLGKRASVIIALLVAVGLSAAGCSSSVPGDNSEPNADSCVVGAWELNFSESTGAEGYDSSGTYVLTFDESTVTYDIDVQSVSRAGDGVRQAIEGSAVQTYAFEGSTLTFGEVLSSAGTATMTPPTGSGESDDAQPFSPNSEFSVPATCEGDLLTLTFVVNDLPSARTEQVFARQ